MKSLSVLLVTSCLIVVVSACGQDAESKQKGSQNAAAPADPLLEVDAAKNSQDALPSPRVDLPTPLPTPGAEQPHRPDVVSPVPPAGGPSPAAGLAFFNSSVAPMLQIQCVRCHADPRQPADIRAPLSIYSYTAMRPKLAAGSKSPEANDFIGKMRNQISHMGGDRCADNGLTASPCKEIVAWWKLEFGSTPVTAGDRGKITEVSSFGVVYGYAFNAADMQEQVKVNFYADGPKGVGTAAGSTVANIDAPDGNTAGAHAFKFELPAALKNGKPHELFGYAVIQNLEVPLLESGASTRYTAYSYTTAGRAYFDATVRPRMTVCAGCHTVAYEQQFAALISPSPSGGGTATNNQLFNKPSQSNGITHGGGLRCANGNASPCREIRAWWAVEFGG